MKRLGYNKFVAQGGDWGAVVVDMMGLQAPPELLGIHTNMPGIFPNEVDQAAFSGKPAPSGLSADEMTAYDQWAGGFGARTRRRLYVQGESPTQFEMPQMGQAARQICLDERVFIGPRSG